MLLRATIAGVKGVVATASFRTGDAVLRLSGRLTAIPNDRTVFMNKHLYIMDPRIAHARRDMDSNVAVRKGFLLASESIHPGDEIKLPFCGEQEKKCGKN